MGSEIDRAYMLVILEPGKDEEFAHAVVSKGLIVDSTVERMDFVHGPFDFIITLKGTRESIDSRIIEMRKLPFVRKTETLIPFDMFSWDDVSASLKESP
jgi:hypothetical protein